MLWFGVALFCFAAALYFSGRERQYVGETARLRRQLETASVELAEWRQAAPNVNAADSVEIRVGPHEPNGPSAHIFVQPGHAIALIASHLPALAPDKTYAVWFVRPNQTAVAAGAFLPGPEGSAVHVERNAPMAVSAATMLVTVENAAASSGPSTAHVFEAWIPVGK
jgi:hypothetical protein